MINEKETKSNICKFLKCKPTTLDRYLKIFNISYKGNQGLKNKKNNKRKTTSEYLKNSFISSPRLRKKLIQDGIKDDKCEICKLNEWLGQKLPLELHHKDGNRYNNKIENLQILCPNCHSLTPNHSGKIYDKKIKNRIKENKFCSCGEMIRKNSKQCLKCYHISQQNNEKPKYDVLLNDVKILGYTGTGRKYNVSDNTIRKWVNKIPL